VSASDSNSLSAFTMTLLRSGDRYLLLQRAKHKSFAPGRWTGIGGKVEPDEFDDLKAAALREIREETGFEGSQIQNLTLRRSLLQQRPGHPITVLLYFTGDLEHLETPQCEEGTLHWLTPEEIDKVDVIENTRLVIPHLIADVESDPTGNSPLVTGAATFDEDETLHSVIWSSLSRDA
jgi:8-oxo-dGTP diphosphatase